jgi:ABC-type Fe3+-hydroxamate transport system substrate-binding protein
MSRRLTILSLVLLGLCVTAAVAATAESAKSGTIKSVDANAKTFVLAVTGGRDLTFTVNDKTVITLNAKDSNFVAAIKADSKATVNYTRAGEKDRVATKVEVTAAEAKPAK